MGRQREYSILFAPLSNFSGIFENFDNYNSVSLFFVIFHNILPIINDIENILGVLFGFFRGHFLGFRQGSKIFRENFTQETGTTKTPVLITGTFVWKSAVFERFSVDPGVTPRKSVEKSRKRPLKYF